MFKVGVDVGGTFTDVLLVDTKSSSFFTSKVPSTPEDSSQGVLNGIKKKPVNWPMWIWQILKPSHTEQRSQPMLF